MNITQGLLTHYRQKRKLTTFTVAKRMKLTENKIIQFENGRANPTLRQLKQLAKLYKVPFAAMFLNEIPDFRLLKIK